MPGVLEEFFKNGEGGEEFKQQEGLACDGGKKGWLPSQCNGGRPAATPARHHVKDN